MPTCSECFANEASFSPNGVKGGEIQPRFIVFTDLDGTILNHHTYAYQAVLPLLAKLRESNVPVVLNSSKTLSELVMWQQTFALDTPVIAENGGVVQYRSDSGWVEHTGRTRSINRKRWGYQYLKALIESGQTSNAEIIKRITNILQRRKKHKAFHPETPQRIVDIGSGFFALWRDDDGLKFPLLAIHNLTSDIKIINLSHIEGLERHAYWVNLLDNRGTSGSAENFVMQPYQSVWLMPETVDDVSALWAPYTD